MNSKANCHGRVKPTRVARICVLLPQGYKYLQAVLFFFLSHLEERSCVCPCTADVQEHLGCSCLCSLPTQAHKTEVVHLAKAFGRGLHLGLTKCPHV